MLVYLLMLIFSGAKALLTIPASLVLMEQLQSVPARLPLFLAIVAWLALMVFSAYALLRIALRRSLFVARLYLLIVFGVSGASMFLTGGITVAELLLQAIWQLLLAGVFFCIRPDRVAASSAAA